MVFRHIPAAISLHRSRTFLNTILNTQVLMVLKLGVSIFNIVLAVAAVSITLITATTLGLADSVFAQGPAKFGFNLTGSQEVPPVQTNATGIIYYSRRLDNI
jgi:hypothetical protein